MVPSGDNSLALLLWDAVKSIVQALLIVTSGLAVPISENPLAQVSLQAVLPRIEQPQGTISPIPAGLRRAADPVTVGISCQGWAPGEHGGIGGRAGG